MKKIILICVILVLCAKAQSQTQVSSNFKIIGSWTETHKHTYQKIDTLKTPRGTEYRFNKAYMTITVERNGKAVNDTTINDSLNTIRCLLKQIDKERATIDLYKKLILKLEVKPNDKKSLSILKKLGYSVK